MRGVRRGAGHLSGLRADFSAAQLTTTLATGLILALVNVLATVALSSLIFRGDLEEFLPAGIGLGLVGAALVGLIMALASKFRGMYAGMQDAPAAIISLSAVSIAGVLTGMAAFDTVVAMIVVTSLATGLVFLAMGHLGLGDIARFVPFPVIGGLLAGSGYLILAGALAIVGAESLSDVGGPDTFGTLWPALALGGLLFIVTRKGWSSRTYLLLLVAAVAVFHSIAAIGGIGIAEALDRGWVLGPFPTGALWPGFILDSLTRADWALIAGEAVSLVTILLIGPISLLLYISALEIETRTDIDMNRELRGTGWSNVAAAAVGGSPGYMYLADTVITARLVGMRRGPAVVTPVVMMMMAAFGGFALEFLPRFVVGGLLLFVGAEFLYEWTWASRRRMTKPDYALMLVIVVVIATIGFLPGVAVGLVAAVALFVVRYSRIDVVKHSLTGREHQSNIERAATDAEYLRYVGGATLILELQGFVFFGTASRILSRIRARLDNTSELQFVVCDFRRVTGVDSSAVAIFERIALVVRERATALVLTGMESEQRDQFDDLVSRYRGAIVLEPDLDHGTAWCEDRLLEAAGLGAATGPVLPESLQNVLGRYLERQIIPSGELIMRQGDPSPGIYLISSGQATVQLDEDEGHSLRLRTLLGGTVLGEISLYRNEPVTATVVADTDCEVLHLSPGRFDEMCRSDPVVAAELHQFVARTLAGRVSHANLSIRALHD
ncbi:MAG TPA: cyclic nucleotide-binding domain-containing protein [Acidimicrobiia bacterium]|nr:cyclic nucleotide-binding domain-containing protein [Acidimicrobiia bacterium]